MYTSKELKINNKRKRRNCKDMGVVFLVVINQQLLDTLYIFKLAYVVIHVANAQNM